MRLWLYRKPLPSTFDPPLPIQEATDAPLTTVLLVSSDGFAHAIRPSLTTAFCQSGTCALPGIIAVASCAAIGIQLSGSAPVLPGCRTVPAVFAYHCIG